MKKLTEYIGNDADLMNSSLTEDNEYEIDNEVESMRIG